MHLYQLRYLVEISNCQSLAAAGEKLHITHQALSVSIRALENELNIQLLDRTSKGVSLTPKGRELVALSQDFLNQLAAFSQITPKRIQQKFPIACTYQSLTHYLYRNIDALKNNFPELDIQFCEFTSNTDVLQALIAKEVEIAFISPFICADSPKFFIPKNLRTTHCADVNLYCELDQDLPYANAQSLSLEVLQQYDVLCYFSKVCVAQHPQPFPATSLLDASTASFLQFVKTCNMFVESNYTIYLELLSKKTHIGLNMLSQQSLALSPLPPHLRRIPLKEPAKFELSYVTLANKKFSQAASAFLQALLRPI